MKTVFRIARLELSTLFYSPVAWLVLIVFTFQSGLEFTGTIVDLKGVGDLNYGMPGITSMLFGSFLGAVQSNLYLYIPLLTMGLISREIHSGSIKLLLSSPVRIREIVLGKFMAMMAYGLIMVFVLFLFTLVGKYSIISGDFTMTLCGLLGIYLLILAYSAIGLLMSCFTSYQVVAAISTFVVLGTLQVIGGLWQNIDLIRNITYFLSISGRADQFIRGLISTKDLFYFIIVTALFLGAAMLLLQSARESRPAALKAARYSLLLAAGILLVFITAQPSFTAYFDLTATKSQTLTPATQNIIKQLKEPLKIHTYVNFLDGFCDFGLPDKRSSDHAFFERYQRFMPRDIPIDYVYYYDTSMNDALYKQNPGLSDKELAENVADSKDFNFEDLLPPDKIKNIIDLKPEQNRYVRQLESGGKTAFLRMFYDMEAVPGEREITAALNELITVPPKVIFLTGHNERSAFKEGDRDYADRLTSPVNRQALINHGFEFSEVALDTANIPANTTVLVIADPTLDIKEPELEKIRKYIASGGNVMIAGEPGRQDKVRALINPLGIQFMDGTLLEESKEFAPNFIIAGFSKEAAAYSDELRTLVSDSARLTTHGAVGLKYTDTGSFKITPFVISNGDISWNRVGSVSKDTGQLKYNQALGDKKQSWPIALALTRQGNNKEQRIMVFGDADFMSNGEFSGVPKKNWELTAEVFRWFCYGQCPLNIKKMTMPDNKVDISPNGVLILRIVFLGIIPGLLLLWGAFLLISRRRA